MSVKSRLKALERRSPGAGAEADGVNCILFHEVAPSPDGPQDMGPMSAMIIGGPTLARLDGESADDFLARVDAETAMSLQKTAERNQRR